MEPYWYKNAVIYGVDVRSFCDSNGDGFGDLPGLTSKLDYLQRLGVTCLWILPIYRTPLLDNGYDISDYCSIDPRVGTFDDFLNFLAAAGERGIGVVLDLVMNHTSNQHPWFEASRRSSTGDHYRDYYVWTEVPPPTTKENIFPTEEAGVWKWDELAKAFYYHRFYHFQPDLNIANVQVRAEIHRVLEFWSSFNVVGFRIDAAPHMIEEKGLPEAKPDDPHGVLREFRQIVNSRRSYAMLLGESDEPVEHLADFFGDGDELNMVFNFYLDNYLMLALASEEAEPIRYALDLLPTIPQPCQWANFLRNLDELDLERLTPEERDVVYKAFAPEEDMRIYDRGIRRRLAPMLAGDRRRLEMAYSLLFSLPGTPVIVYGDEIGLGGNLALPDRNAVRTAMQWSSEPQAGFSTADESTIFRPPVGKGNFGYRKLNVAQQEQDEHSLLNWFKQLIKVRRETPELGWGVCHLLNLDHSSLLVHACEYRSHKIVAAHNLSGKPAEATITLAHSRKLIPIFGHAEVEPLEAGRYQVRCGGYGYAWFRLE